MIAWVLRFGLFGLGNPGDGLWMFILSMLVYGVAFDFFNVSGALFVEKETDPSIQASAQGLFMLMTNGIGASVGTLAAGAVVDHFCKWEGMYLLGDWRSTWLILLDMHYWLPCYLFYFLNLKQKNLKYNFSLSFYGNKRKINFQRSF